MRLLLIENVKFEDKLACYFNKSSDNLSLLSAGVLRGEKSHFQLFGDTVNTASQMMRASKPNKINCSKKTAALLAASGKESWLIPCAAQADSSKGTSEVSEHSTNSM